MFRRWLTVEGELETLSPLHVGTGGSRTIQRSDGGETQVAEVVRDGDGRPYIPGSSVKGVLRSLLPAEADPGRLFGSIRGAEGGELSPLTCYGAAMAGAAPDVKAYPSGEDMAKERAGVYISARTRIDRRRGVADDHKLFHQEMTAPGARFALRLRLALDCPPEKAEARETLLKTVLNALKRPDGIAMGKSGAKGFGRVRLDVASLNAQLHELQPGGQIARTDRTSDLSAAYDPETDRSDMALERRRIALRCPGPFIIIDSSRKETGADKAQLQAQRTGPNRPLVDGSSIVGALRARALWLARLDALRASEAEPQDDPDKVLADAGEAESLSPVERLFGVTGWRGTVAASVVDVEAAAEKMLTSVSVDRLTGGARDGAFFKTRCFVDVSLTLSLTLADRAGALKEGDRRLFERLVESIETDGLQLGHGTTKGFGWFETKTTASERGGRDGAG